MMRIARVCALLSLAALSFAWAQSTKAPAFESAFVRISPKDGGGYVASNEAGRVVYEKIPMKLLLMIAYRLKEYQVEGPPWIVTEKYDIAAKAPYNTPKDQVPLMLRPLLTEKFGLKFHSEMRDLPVYELSVGKSPLKLKQAPANGSFGIVKGRREAKGMGMQQLTGFLALWLGRPVIDKTGLQGPYDFRLELSKEEAGPAGADKPLLSVFTSLQEIGLNLESKTTPLEVLIVDGGSPTPVEN
jgi:uncharacterized protein (TIGR03435 family)